MCCAVAPNIGEMAKKLEEGLISGFGCASLMIADSVAIFAGFAGGLRGARDCTSIATK